MMMQISFPSMPRDALLKEACATWNIHHSRANQADPITSSWPLLYNVVHAHLRHTQTDYDQRLLNGEGPERDRIHGEIKKTAALHYPWLRLETDPRVQKERAAAPRRGQKLFAQASRKLSDLVTERAHLVMRRTDLARRKPINWRSDVAGIDEELRYLDESIKYLTGLFSIKKHIGDEDEGSPFGIIILRREQECYGYSFGGRALAESYTKAMPFGCDACGQRVFAAKGAIDHGCGIRLGAYSCHCTSVSIAANMVPKKAAWDKYTIEEDDAKVEA
jgi:hypothetical protein